MGGEGFGDRRFGRAGFAGGACLGIAAAFVLFTLPGDPPAPPPSPTPVAPPSTPKITRFAPPTPRADPPPAAVDAPATDPHRPATQAWIALDHRARAFLAQPLAPQLPPDPSPEAEDLAFQQALLDRLDALDALEEELLALAQDRSEPRRALQATVTLAEVHAELGAQVEQLPVPAHLGPRQAARQARRQDARAAEHLRKAQMLFEIAANAGAAADPELAARVLMGQAAALPPG